MNARSRHRALLIALVTVSCNGDKKLPRAVTSFCGDLVHDLEDAAKASADGRDDLMMLGRPSADRAAVGPQLHSRISFCRQVRRDKTQAADLGERFVGLIQTFRETHDAAEFTTTLKEMARVASDLNKLPLED